jgi:uncharacterized membrane protein
MKFNARKIALIAVLTAVTFLATYLLRIPIGSSTYFNLSEAVVYAGALLFGRLVGGLAGGLGAALADILLGFALPWAPISFLVKGLEGFIVGLVARLPWKHRLLGDVVSILSAFPIMVGGYVLSAGLIYGWPAAYVEFVTDVIQCAAGLAIALPIVYGLRRARIAQSW